ncbi:TonB-dependent receptor [Halosquirtibacter laminarini]|uniref:TonB-dependent receptor n=1 Tax=Halosquirtibacter laminarini TaxID=3374600 RepID=A0AC61NPF8_9BACT|nr:TonB-dependent receptor [Prolixibacteraceae bacterium]
MNILKRPKAFLYRFIVLGVVLIQLTSQAYAQKISLTGEITDERDQPLPGANVMIKGTTVGAVSDFNGIFQFSASKGDTLVFTFIGYNPQYKVVGQRSVINVQLTPSTEMIDDVVIVGFGKQKRESVIGAISTVDTKELSIPSRSLSNSLAGKVSGIISVQRSGEPGFDNSTFWIRGISSLNSANSQPLLLVDGVERGINDIDPEDIESFSVLKDAAASAVYGVRGANGVIIINTKRGKASEKLSVDVKVDYGVLTPTKLPNYVGAPKFMELENEARVESGLPEKYSSNQIYTTRMGGDTDLYPNVNWMDAVMNKYASNRKVHLNVRGGSSKVRYFVSGAYYGEDGIYKKDKSQNYNSNISINRFNFRSNVDVDLTQKLTLSLNLGGYLSGGNYPGQFNSNSGTQEIFNWANSTTPNLFPIKYSDGTLSGPKSGENPWLLLTQTGFVEQWRSKTEMSFYLTQDLSSLTEGLNAKLLYSYDVYNVNTIKNTRLPSYFRAYGRDGDGSLLYNNAHEGSEDLGYKNEMYGSRRTYLEGSLNYSRTFAANHTVGALLLYNQRNYIHTAASNAVEGIAQRDQGLAGRLTYAYLSRYFVEGNFGYNGSENFAKNHRYGFFPSVSVGWLISEENFMSNSRFLTKLKVRGSYGLAGNDNIGGRRFAYLSLIDSQNGNYTWGTNQQIHSNGYLQEGAFGSPNLTWETAKKADLGLKIGLWNALQMQVDFFHERRDNIFIQRSTIPGTAGFAKNPYVNYGVVENRGLDASFDLHKQFGDWSYNLRGTFTYAKNKVIEKDEPKHLWSYQDRTGQPVNQQFGLVANGLFEKSDFANVEKGILKNEVPEHTFGPVRPGDIKYVDMNGDNRIDSYDETAIGRTTIPEIIYGFGLNVKYKRLDFGAYFQGISNVTRVLTGGAGFYPFQQGAGRGNLLSDVIDDRWTPENPRQDVFYPRLYYGQNSNNYRSSTWWQKDMSYLRLKDAEIGFTFVDGKSKKAIRNLRLYVRGSNLFTWDTLGLWDPEVGSSNGAKYPLSKIVSVGINANF